MLHRFFIKTPWWARRLFPGYTWRLPSPGKAVYLTFDDGPHPEITPWVLAQLRTHNAKATFFCIGQNVAKQPETYRQILEEGHSVGNHTHRHLNGWKTESAAYLADAARAAACIQSPLFRPPYGKIKASQAKGLNEAMGVARAQVVMWDVLSADFDKSIRPERCTQNVLENVEGGSVVVFHDSEKAFGNLRVALPAVLKSLGKEGYEFRKIAMETP